MKRFQYSLSTLLLVVGFGGYGLGSRFVLDHWFKEKPVCSRRIESPYFEIISSLPDYKNNGFVMIDPDFCWQIEDRSYDPRRLSEMMRALEDSRVMASRYTVDPDTGEDIIYPVTFYRLTNDPVYPEELNEYEWVPTKDELQRFYFR